MPGTTFHIFDSSLSLVFTSTSLKEIWKFLKTQTTDYRDWIIQERDKEDRLSDSCNAEFLVKKYKSANGIPETLAQVGMQLNTKTKRK